MPTLTFKAKIYKTGINWAVDVPKKLSDQLIPKKGYIRIVGTINGFNFTQTLVPVKNAPYRLFVNLVMMKGGKTAVGNVASFEIAQNFTLVDQMYAMPKLLQDALDRNNLNNQFNQLTAARRKDILKYLSFIKTEETLVRNIEKLIRQLTNGNKDVRIP